MSISFVGAGPGAVDLITLRGLKALQSADCIVYAGSLVNPEHLAVAKESCAIYDSASMHLDEIMDTMLYYHHLGQKVVRLHTGDFSLFGSLREQTERLNHMSVAYELIPGVSSFLGAASSIQREYTVPEVSQSLIITRIEGRTPVPTKESIRSFAQHQTSMVIFLSTDRLQDVCEELIEGGYPKTTPMAVVYKATWPDERILKGTIETMPDILKASGITKTALIMVGDFLGDEFHDSKLYDKDFKHAFRP
jgi:precorrin-4/cobalt-precorrin-4 C11-methyltransferase